MLIDPWPNSDKPPLVSPAPVLQITLRPFKNTPAGYRCSLLTAAATGTTRSTSNLTQSAMGTLDDRFPLNSKLKLPQLVCSAQLHELSYTVKLAAFISRPAVENYDDGLAQSSPLLFLRKALDRV